MDTHPSTSAAASDASAVPIRDSGPIGDSERLIGLDVVRGVALLGIFCVNMMLFSGPFAEMMPGGEPHANRWDEFAAGFVHVCCSMKFITTFSLLFGAGLAMQMIRAMKGGRDFLGTVTRRLTALGVIGVLHAVGLWYGDILYLYSLVGFVLLIFIRLAPRWLIVAAISAWFVGIVLGTGLGALQVVGLEMQPDRYADATVSADRPGIFAVIHSQGDPMHPQWVASETTAFQSGPWRDAVVFRVILWLYALMFGLLGYGWHVLAMFLLGAAFMKLGFFGPAWRRTHIALACIAIPAGLAVEGLNAWIVSQYGYLESWPSLVLVPLVEVSSVTLSLGYVGFWLWFGYASWGSWLRSGLASMGRMALTNYLFETTLATFVMYWWGLGWFGSTPPAQQLLVVITIYLALMLFSVVWLQRFRMGPMEWLWRSVTYWKPQPLIRAAAA